MKKYTLHFLFASLLLVLTGCDKDSTDGAYDVGFELATQDFALEFEDTNVSLMVEVKTNTVSSAPRFVSLNVANSSTASADSYSVPDVIRIPENSSSAFILVDIQDPSGSFFPSEEEFSLILEVVESDSYTITQPQTILIIQRNPCPYPAVAIEFLFDDYASEVSWEILDSANTVVASGGSYPNLLATYSQSFCLMNGTYTFNISDSFGDGISFPNDGYVKITVDGTEVLSIEGNFGSSASGNFTF